MPTSTVVPSGIMASSGRADTSDGGRIAWLIRWVCRNPVSAGPATRTSSGATTRRAPSVSAMTSSNTATSKPTDANCSTRDDASTPIRSAAVAASDAMPSWGSTTPLGRPVEPDVKIT